MKFHEDGTMPDDNSIWVFGSNLAGIHGGGAARIASKHYGLPYGKEYSVGFYGRTYAIPTKDENIETLDIEIIKKYVDNFIEFVMMFPEDNFFITRVGCGLAGFSDSDIAPLFKPLTKNDNVTFAKQWREYVTQSN